jgi:hypothetical protein
LSLPLLGWMPLCLYRQRLGHPGFRRKGLHHTWGHATARDCTAWGHLIPTKNFYLIFGAHHSGPSPGCWHHWGLAAYTFCSLSFATWAFVLYLVHHGFGNPFCFIARPWPWWVGPPLVPTGLWTLLVALLRCFASSGITFLALSFLFWASLGICHFRLDHPGLRRNSDAFEGFYHPWYGAKPLLGAKSSLGNSYVMPSMLASNQDYLIPGVLFPMPSLRMCALLGLGLQWFLLQGLCLTGHISSALVCRCWHPYAFISLVATFRQERHTAITGTKVFF